MCASMGNKSRANSVRIIDFDGRVSVRGVHLRFHGLSGTSEQLLSVTEVPDVGSTDTGLKKVMSCSYQVTECKVDTFSLKDINCWGMKGKETPCADGWRERGRRRRLLRLH